MHATEIAPVKDGTSEQPIPSAWRSAFREIVAAFVRGDFKVNSGVAGLSPVSDDVAEQIEEYVADYGEELTDLSEETWKSSVAIWRGDHWDALVDLWTVREGRSDLVLQASVRESQAGFTYQIDMVYVP